MALEFKASTLGIDTQMPRFARLRRNYKQACGFLAWPNLRSKALV